MSLETLPDDLEMLERFVMSQLDTLSGSEMSLLWMECRLSGVGGADGSFTPTQCIDSNKLEVKFGTQHDRHINWLLLLGSV